MCVCVYQYEQMYSRVDFIYSWIISERSTFHFWSENIIRIILKYEDV